LLTSLDDIVRIFRTSFSGITFLSGLSFWLCMIFLWQMKKDVYNNESSYPMTTSRWGKLLSRLARFLRQLIKSHKGRLSLLAGLGFFVILLGISLLARDLKFGAIMSYYENTDWIGPPKFVTRTRFVNLNHIKHVFPKRNEYYCIEWKGFLFIRHSGEYEFTTVSDDGSDLSVDHQMIVENGGMHGFQERSGIVYLEKGLHSIRTRFMQVVGIAYFRAYVAPVGKKRIDLSQADILPKQPKHLTNAIITLRPVIHTALIVLWILILITAFLESSAWWSAMPLLGRLAIFFILNALVLNHILSLTGERTTLYYTKFFLTSPIHDRSDSWGAMYAALTHLHTQSEIPLYQEVFFHHHIKFQYPPTSLLWLNMLPKWTFEGLVHRLNLLSWFSILVSTGLLAALYSQARRQYSEVDSQSFVKKILTFCIAFGFTVTFYPLMRSFQLGQIQTELYVVFCFALWAWMRKKKGLSGVCIGVMCTIKPQLGLLVVWGSIRKEWRFVAAIIMTTVGIGLISLSLFGWNNHLDYLHVLSYISRHGESYFPNQSVNGLLNRLLFNGPNLMGDGHSFAQYQPWVYMGTILSSLILIASVVFWKHSHYRHAELPDFLIAVLGFTMASPVAWEHHYSVLLPMFAVTLPLVLAITPEYRNVVWFALSFTLASNFYAMANRLAGTHLNVLQSTLFLSAVLFLLQLYHLRRIRHASRFSRHPDVNLTRPNQKQNLDGIPFTRENARR